MYKRDVLLPLFRIFLCIAVSLPVLRAQEPKESAPQEMLNLFPGGLDRHAASLGSRMLRTGKERSIVSGTLIGERGDRIDLRVTLELPALVRVEGLRPDGSALIYDGKTGVYPNTRLEEALLEIFSSDTTEGMLASVRQGAAIQLLGRRVGSVRDWKSNDDLRHFDIYEVGGTVSSSARSLERLKRYFFDSETGLLDRTQYVDDTFAPPLDVVTEFSEWRIQDGSAYPGRIDRRENDRTAFSFTVTSIIALPRLDPINLGASTHTTRQEE